ncbi:GCG_CRPN prefix-to-repeats domain-containing protein [Microvirga sp. M2]|uniref:GCG_CRPN prefix-to-repeats domain-containing protein n=1 Tax=Microvirga sp. M2 TaxID=3073270 RepID=UPI0039C048CC
MKFRRLITIAALVFGAWLGMASLEQGRVGVAPAAAAQGCGPGFHRGPYGYCRPNAYGRYYGVPRYYYRGGYYGRPYYGYRRPYYGRPYYGYRGGYYRRRY